MANRFVHFANKETFTGTSNYATVYEKSIVFLQDTQEIWTHGTYYAIPDAYKTKITNLETAVKALLDLTGETFSFKQIKAGSTTVNAASGKETITFKEGSGINLTLSEAGELTIASNVTSPVTGVKSGDKVLAMSGTELTSTISLKYVKADKKIYLYGIDQNTPISYVECDDFVIDGMIDGDETYFDEEDKVLHLVLNTDGGSKDIEVDLSKLVDTYDGSNLKLKTVTVPGTYTEPAANDSVDSAIGALIAGIRETKASAGVTKFGDKTGDITIDTVGASGKVKFTMDNNKLTGEVVNGVTTEGTLADGTLIVGAGNKAVKTLASGTEGQVLAVGENGLEWKNITDADTTYTFANGANGSFTVTPKNGTPQTVSIGKPATAGTADQVENELTIKLNGGEGIVFDGSEAKEVNITPAAIGAATTAQGAKADTALQSISKGTDGDYVTTTVTEKGSGTTQTVGVAVTVQAISTASTSAKGLVEASDVKKYIDDMWEWEEK